MRMRGDLLHSKKLCGLHPAVAGEDAVLRIDQHRDGEAEQPDAFGNLVDLLLRVPAGIALPRLQLSDGTPNDIHPAG